jgi:hypothetical protein
MRRKIMVFVLILAMVTGLIPATALAASPPSEISAPENFAAADYMGISAVCTLSAPDDLRKLISQTTEERGYYMMIMAQVDFKTDGGNWHYTPEWDDKATYSKYVLYYYNSLVGGDSQKFLGSSNLNFREMFPEESNIPVQSGFNSWDWYKSHSMTLRARFVIQFEDNLVFSDWSEEYTLSHSSKMDYRKIMNENAPTLLSSKIETRGPDNVPWVVLQLARHPAQVQKFNAAAHNSMWTEIWLRKLGDTEFKNVGAAPFCDERLSLDISAYFQENLANYDAQAYEVKVRYKIDERSYEQSGAADMNWLYSPFSNTLSYGMPAWSAASGWAESELEKADEYGLIPDILIGADMTKPITREEFCELALVLYEKTTGGSPEPYTPNLFTDTTNPQILKAFALGITKGTSATTFTPDKTITRQECATMLFRTIKAIAPDADYSIAGVPDFPDQKDIDSWAADGAKYMPKLGIIKGDSRGYFMPKATTTAQEAAGYGTATREAAVLMSVRTYEVLP